MCGPEPNGQKPFYGKARAGKMFEFEEFNGGHEWRGDVARAFLRRHLGGQ